MKMRSLLCWGLIGLGWILGFWMPLQAQEALPSESVRDTEAPAETCLQVTSEGECLRSENEEEPLDLPKNCNPELSECHPKLS